MSSDSGRVPRPGATNRDTVSKAVFLPEVSVGEGVAGTVFEMAFEGLGFPPAGEIDGDDEFPRRDKQVRSAFWRRRGQTGS